MLGFDYYNINILTETQITYERCKAKLLLLCQYMHRHIFISNGHEVTETARELKIIYTFLQYIYAFPLTRTH